MENTVTVTSPHQLFKSNLVFKKRCGLPGGRIVISRQGNFHPQKLVLNYSKPAEPIKTPAIKYIG